MTPSLRLFRKYVFMFSKDSTDFEKVFVCSDKYFLALEKNKISEKSLLLTYVLILTPCGPE